MSPLKIIFSPAEQNALQRAGTFVTLVLVTLILRLHFPFDGYVLEHSVITRYGTGECPKDFTLDTLKAATQADLKRHFDRLRKCTDEEEMQLLPLSEWRTASPIINWFGPVVHAVSTIAFVLLLGGLWLWMYRTPIQQSK